MTVCDQCGNEMKTVVSADSRAYWMVCPTCGRTHDHDQEAQTEAIATALKACLALVEFADAAVKTARMEVLEDAVVYARKAIKMGAEIK